MKGKLFIAIVIISGFAFPISAQKANLTPDQITRINGKEIKCKIISIDSVKIDLMHYSAGYKEEAFLLLKSIANYTYMDETIYLNKVETFQPAVKQPIKPDFKKALHVDGQPGVVVRLSLLAPAFIVEAKLTPKSTFIFRFWSGFVFASNEHPDGSKTSEYIFIPGFAIGPRFYLSLDKRAAIGKRVDYFSSSYVQVPVTLAFYKGIPIVSIGGLWGFQRTLGKKGYWNIGVGAGFSGSKDQIAFGLISEFGLGFILSK